MKIFEITPQMGARKLTLNDIVFEFRNKAYGAYDLRQNYPIALRNALIIGVSLFLAALILPSIYTRYFASKDAYIDHGEVVFCDIPITKSEKELVKIEQPKTPPKQAMQRFVVPEVTTETQETELPPKIEELEHAAVSDITQAGVEEELPIVAPTATGLSEEAKVVEVKPQEVFETYNIDIQPEFVGGRDAFINYLQKSLKYPNQASQAGVEGKVFLQFTIEPDGSLSNVGVSKGIGFGCDEEALRVVKAMPKWKPGKQSGRAVRVKFNLPIVFTLQ